MFQGSYVAIVTPFRNGRIDEPALARLIEMHVSAGTDGIVPCGTTGESPTLTHEEHDRMVELTVKLVNGRMKVMAGTGSNNTAEAVRLSKAAEKAGADACLVINPYYNKPTQRGLYEHFKTVANAVKIPIIVYNIQSRTAVNIATPTLADLAKIPNIVGVKEASGDLAQMSDVAVSCGPNFAILSGDDALTLPLLSVGGHGVISVVANIIPRDVKEMISAYNSGNTARATELHKKMFPLVKAMFVETNPIPVKTALAMMGLVAPEFRLPLTPMEEANQNKLREAMITYGLRVS
jgi:4-hydroxy-tetrahydrodipicolinate synthase